MTDGIKKIIKTPAFRMAYPALFQTEEYQGRITYGTDAVFPPNEKEKLKEMKKLANHVAKEKWGDKLPKNLKSPFIDGNEYNENRDNHRPELKDAIFLRLRTTNKPEVTDLESKGAPIRDQTLVYSGRWAKATVYCHAYDTQGSKGVTFLLNNVLLLQDDEPWGAPKASAEDDFKAEFGSSNNETGNETEDDDYWL